MNNDEIWNHLKNLNDDVIIASTIKSGTTWLQQIVAQIIFESKFNQNLNETSLWIDTLRDFTENELLDKIGKQNHRKFLKTHSPASVVYKNNSNLKYLFITRDFRDVVWSFFNHFVNSKYKILDKSNTNSITKKLRESSDPYEFWNIIMDNQDIFYKCKSYKIIWSYFDTIKTWLQVKDNDNVLILHFNDLKKNLKGNIINISKFLGYNYDDEIINKIHYKCTFEYMKNNSTKCVPFAFKNSKNFINKGTNKRWKDKLSEEDLDKYKKLITSFFEDQVVEWIENGSIN